MTAFADQFVGTAGPLDGRVSDTGHVWDDFNGALELDGNGRCIRKPTATAEGRGGSYGQINLDDDVTSMSGVVSWTGASDTVVENGVVALIYSNADVHGGTVPNRHIFADAIHPTFGPWATALTIYIGGVALAVPRWFWAYPGGRLNVDGTQYPCGIERRSRILTINRPDGVSVKIADPLFESLAGPYLIFQTYDVVAPNLTTRFESVAATTEALSGFVAPLPLPATLGREVER